MKTFLKWYYRLRRITPDKMPMVRYWTFKESTPAKVTKRDGSIVMDFEGEDYVFPTFPRGRLLLGSLSKLKHEIKNRLFNESWWELEEGVERKQIVQNIKRKFFVDIAEIAYEARYDMLPPNSMCISMKEFWRAWDKAEGNELVKKVITYILQEDDSYRFRMQWMIDYWKPSLLHRNVIKNFDKAFEMLEHAEVVDDMKERVRLFRRILLLLLEDKENREFFKRFCKELNWRKMQLTKADKYHFRGKYFKVDYQILEY